MINVHSSAAAPTAQFKYFHGVWTVNVDPRPWIDDPQLRVRKNGIYGWIIESKITTTSRRSGHVRKYQFPEPIRGFIYLLCRRMNLDGIRATMTEYAEHQWVYQLQEALNSHDLGLSAFFRKSWQGVIRYDPQAMHVTQAVKMLIDTAYGRFTQMTAQPIISAPDDHPVESDDHDYPWLVVDRDRPGCVRRVEEFRRLGIEADLRYRCGVQLILTHPQGIVQNYSDYTPPVILSLDPEDLLRNTRIYSRFADIPLAWIYALQSDRTQIDPPLRRRALALYGPRRHHLKPPNQRAVHVRLHRFVPSEPPPRDASGWAQRRWLTNHSQRNHAIAELATTEADLLKIRILAASLDHAANLSTMMPSAAILASESADLTDLDEAVIGRIRRGDADRGEAEPLLIVTPEGLPGLAAGDLLIRADGGTARLELSPALLHHGVGPLTLVDLQDEHPPVYHQNAHERLKVYRNSGWVIETE